MNAIAHLRTLASELVARASFAQNLGLTFGGKRDTYEVFGYKKNLEAADFMSRYSRNGVAHRIVEAMPRATWRGGAELIEDEDPTVLTEFEQAWVELNSRLKIWSILNRADILAGLGRYSVVFLGFPGDLQSPVTRVSNPMEFAYLSVFGEIDVTIEKWVTDSKDVRFGLPETYGIKRLTPNPQDTGKREVHWSRIIHLADGLLDNRVYGQSRLECVWNDLDDLEKVRGGGAEAFWLRANQGLQIDVPPDVTLTPDAETRLNDEVEEYQHNVRRIMRTRGVKVTPLGSDVAQFGPQISSIMELISTGTGIPQRILMGSERGELASSQDKTNWDERVQDRRTEFAGPHVVQVLVDRLVDFGVLPAPKKYVVRWPKIENLDDNKKADIAVKWASLNQYMGKEVVTTDEIRDRLLNLDPLDDSPSVNQKIDRAAAVVSLLAAKSKKKFQRSLMRRTGS